MAAGRGSDEGLGVVSLVEEPRNGQRPEVVHQLVNGDFKSVEEATEALNTQGVALVQHEYGIYGGPDGVEVVDILSHLDVPVVVTLHTVLTNPTLAQREILERLVYLADAIVVMSHTAFQRLKSLYDVDLEKVRVIPHGASVSPAGDRPRPGPRPVVLTWGLIGPGKGLETSIEAFAGLTDIHPSPLYRILGRTHPKVAAVQGDSYRLGLKAEARALGLEDHVEFDGRFLDAKSLAAAIREADVVLLPYESTEQVTSGVLVEAIAAGKPVVATEFPHAVELLATGAGIVVPHDDPQAMASALRSVLADPALAAAMADEARIVGAAFSWHAVAAAYESVISKLATPRIPVKVTPLELPARRQAVLDNLAQVG
jgi:glycosyltransferase involved in cell wall biosynthesis